MVEGGEKAGCEGYWAEANVTAREQKARRSGPVSPEHAGALKHAVAEEQEVAVPAVCEDEAGRDFDERDETMMLLLRRGRWIAAELVNQANWRTK